MKNFVIGPVEQYPCVKEVYYNPIVYFRSDEFSELVKRTIKKLSDYIGNNTDDSTIYLASSGTGAMEAVVENCVSKSDKVLVVNGGTFGKRFCELLQYHNKKYDSIDLSWGEVLNELHLSEYENQKYTMLFVNLHETSTGQLYDIKLLGEFCKRNHMYLIVDAIGTFLADDYCMSKNNIDVTIISSQKGLCLSSGMAFVSFSQKMLDKINNAEPTSLYFSFNQYLKEIKRGQTPYTPPVHTIYELKAMLEYIENKGGINSWLNFVQEKALYFRNKAKEIGFKIPNYPLSNMLTPLVFEDNTAKSTFEDLKNHYKIYVNPCGGNLADKLIRISHIGNTSIKDIDYLVEKLVEVTKR